MWLITIKSVLKLEAISFISTIIVISIIQDDLPPFSACQNEPGIDKRNCLYGQQFNKAAQNDCANII